MMSRVASARWPGGFRSYQRHALEALDARWASGERRAWVVLPPGAGKTLVGLEAARRLGHRTVVFVPNTAVQNQWLALWRKFDRPDGCTAGTRRSLDHDVTVLTYQSLAVFDPDAETDEEGNELPPLGRLHGNGSALLEALRAAGPVTVILDECHHLLQMWGRLLADVLRELPNAHVLGLTGTPWETLTDSEAVLVRRMFGAPIRGASIPALVRDGYLAPFAELVWITEPTPAEQDYIAEQGLRFTELCTDLFSPGFASTDFVTWLRRRFCERVTDTGEQASWAQLAAQEPELTDAALRLHHAGLFMLPPGARLLERHRSAPTADDWMVLISDYVLNCLAPHQGKELVAPERAADDRDTQAWERIRTALRAIGYTLTRHGIRGGRSPVDRVLARSSAKSQSTVQIIAAESAFLGSRLRALVLCDHERASVRPSPQLRDVLDDQAGSAWLQLELLATDERTSALHPMLVTNRTVAAAPDTADDFIAFVKERRPALNLTCVDTGSRGSLVRIEGRWTSRTWARLVTEYFEEGRCQVLVGTLGLLGEGWDTPRVNTIVDLTTATTPTSVVQGRGRALRLDPEWPEKTAHTWTVVCVSDTHPKGSADWERFVRKHEGYLGAAADGEVMSGVAHVDPALSPYAPPPVDQFADINERMLRRAEDREDTRERWRIGSPYTDELLATVRVRPQQYRGVLAPRPAGQSPQPPPAVPGRAGVDTAEQLAVSPLWKIVLSVPVVAAAVLLVVTAFGLPPSAGLAVAGAVAGGVCAYRLLARRPRIRRAAQLFEIASGEPDILRFGYAIADAMHAAGYSPVGAEGLRLDIDTDGTFRLTFTGAGPAEAKAFSTALDEVISPLVGQPRYIINRYRIEPPADAAQAQRMGMDWLLGKAPENPAVFHAVPALLGRDRRGVEAFARAWNRWLSAGEPIYTASPAGSRLLHTYYATDPYPSETESRFTWL
ncbi:MAG: DEAD/DEAH box helicase family protein [Thermobifida fusca]|jgi:superfamily II DNA or RNA helicase|uniref:DEAD/DEAH box helicase family protein n=3 Tax=Nocardiopsidaceae TaxID=83676 RepID=UPI0015E2B8A2|nr:DEAD/DEAH box helicase family protein [Thermobifida fusca]QOS58952.1 DEAD/DEAH box helicase family protein [Thermobifida fusca]